MAMETMGAMLWSAVALETWLAFMAVSAVLLLIPGPTTLLVVSYALGQGRKVAMPVATGVALGDFTAMTLSMFGVGALLSASTTLFTALKWIGAGYLIWLGIKLWRAGGSSEIGAARDESPAVRMMLHAWVVTALNPKSITFFVAFLPQFLDPSRDFVSQMIVFESTFLVLAIANAFGYALVAGRLRSAIGNSRIVALVNRVGGTLLIGAGVVTLAWRNAK